MFDKDLELSRASLIVSSAMSMPVTRPPGAFSASKRVAHPDPQPTSSTRASLGIAISAIACSPTGRWPFSMPSPRPALAQSLNSKRKRSSIYCPTNFSLSLLVSRLNVIWFLVGNCVAGDIDKLKFVGLLRTQSVKHAREWNRLSNMLDAAHPRRATLDAHSESGMRNTTVAAQVEIPLESLLW